MQTDQEAYVQAVLSLYRRLPDTATHPRRADRRLAAELHRRAIPLDVVEVALRLAQGRRRARPADADPLPPIRSLHYFLPVLDEIPHVAPPAGYLDYLRDTVPDKLIDNHPAPNPTHRTRPSRRQPTQLTLPLETGASPKNNASS